MHLDPVSVIHSDYLPDPVNTLNVAWANRSADYCILDTGATYHVTGNLYLLETFHHIAKEKHQVKTANTSFVNAEGTSTNTFYVDRPNAKPANIVL